MVLRSSLFLKKQKVYVKPVSTFATAGRELT